MGKHKNLTTDLRIEVEPSASERFPGYHVIVVKTTKNGSLRTIQKLVIHSFLRPASDPHAKDLDVLRREANEHAESIGKIFGVQAVNTLSKKSQTAAPSEGD